jgi:hypothetical protein
MINNYANRPYYLAFRHKKSRLRLDQSNIVKEAAGYGTESGPKNQSENKKEDTQSKTAHKGLTN